jgi:hypothetical protein
MRKGVMNWVSKSYMSKLNTHLLLSQSLWSQHPEIDQHLIFTGCMPKSYAGSRVWTESQVQGIQCHSYRHQCHSYRGRKETEQKIWLKCVSSHTESSEWHIVSIPHTQEKNLAQLSGKLIKYLGTQTLELQSCLYTDSSFQCSSNK